MNDDRPPLQMPRDEPFGTGGGTFVVMAITITAILSIGLIFALIYIGAHPHP